MYTPKQFAVTDRDTLFQFMRENSFGILFSSQDGRATATHLPFILQAEKGEWGTLVGHVALANNHWREIDGEVLVVFLGPHSYISPTWYAEEGTVPTWNYLAVHVYGEFELIEDREELKQVLSESISTYEAHFPHPWQTDLESESNQREMKGIKGFRIHIREIQGKWKLNQHHPVERQKRTAEGLQKVDIYDSKEIGRLMEQNIQKDGE